MFFTHTQVRQNTVECLREIADYMDEISRKAGVAKVNFLIRRIFPRKLFFCRLLVQEEGCLRVDSPWLEG